MANIIATGSLGTQAYLGYKMYGGGGAPTTTVTPQAGAVAGGAGAGGAAGAEMAPLTQGSGYGGGETAGAGGGTSTLGYLFAAYVAYKLWQGEKKRGAKYPGQPLLKSIGKSLAKSDIIKRFT